MKALIITYYWPPAGGSGVQRWLKFVKYLRDFDIEPVVYTVENPSYALLDDSLESEIPDDIEVLRHFIWEPNNLLGNKKQTSAGFLDANPSFVGKILQYVRANYFIPDARKYWVQPSIKFLSDYLKNNQIDVVITTGPPHSMHLIGLGLKEELGIKWISDFRDPWTEIDYFHQLPLTKKSMQKHQEIEQKVLRQSDTVLVVGETMKSNYQQFNKNIHIVTNGFDSEVSSVENSLDEKFTLTHIGLMNDDRNPKTVWQVLSEIVKDNKEFANDLSIKLIGKVSQSCLDEIESQDLKSNLVLIDYLPHSEVQEHQKSSQVLLLAINDVPSAKGIITGKIFEYLVAKRPILAIAPTDGDLAEIIRNTNSGTVINFNDAVTLKSTILEFYKKYKEGNLNVDSINIEQYHRKNLTKQLSEVIKSL